MANLANAVEQQKKSMRVLARAKNGRFVRLNPLKVLSELPEAPSMSPSTVESSERALLVASLIDSPVGTKANAIGSNKGQYLVDRSYKKAYYGSFDTGEGEVVSYEELMGLQPSSASANNQENSQTQQTVPNEDTPEPQTPVAAVSTVEEVLPGTVLGNEEKGIKAIWAKYKTYIIAAVVIVLAIVAYKKS